MTLAARICIAMLRIRKGTVQGLALYQVSSRPKIGNEPETRTPGLDDVYLFTFQVRDIGVNGYTLRGSSGCIGSQSPPVTSTQMTLGILRSTYSPSTSIRSSKPCSFHPQMKPRVPRKKERERSTASAKRTGKPTTRSRQLVMCAVSWSCRCNQRARLTSS